jgi:hypothetical protein
MSARSRCDGGDMFSSNFGSSGKGRGGLQWAGHNEQLPAFFFEGHPETWCGRAVGAGSLEEDEQTVFMHHFHDLPRRRWPLARPHANLSVGTRVHQFEGTTNQQPPLDLLAAPHIKDVSVPSRLPRNDLIVLSAMASGCSCDACGISGRAVFGRATHRSDA